MLACDCPQALSGTLHSGQQAGGPTSETLRHRGGLTPPHCRAPGQSGGQPRPRAADPSPRIPGWARGRLGSEWGGGAAPGLHQKPLHCPLQRLHFTNVSYISRQLLFRKATESGVCWAGAGSKSRCSPGGQLPTLRCRGPAAELSFRGDRERRALAWECRSHLPDPGAGTLPHVHVAPLRRRDPLARSQSPQSCYEINAKKRGLAAPSSGHCSVLPRPGHTTQPQSRPPPPSTRAPTVPTVPQPPSHYTRPAAAATTRGAHTRPLATDTKARGPGGAARPQGEQPWAAGELRPGRSPGSPSA